MMEAATLELGGMTVHLRPLAAGDGPALLELAARVPAHDLLFLQRDIREPRVVAAWIEQSIAGTMPSLVAERDGALVGCTALVSDGLSWSRHVTEIRLLTAPEMRGTGLGRRLAETCLAAAADADAEKVLVRLTPDQGAALTLFEDLGFLPEALLRNQVRGADGEVHDIAIMALNVGQARARQEVYGRG